MSDQSRESSSPFGLTGDTGEAAGHSSCHRAGGSTGVASAIRMLGSREIGGSNDRPAPLLLEIPASAAEVAVIDVCGGRVCKGEL